MSERLLTHLRHIDLAVPDFERQREFYTNHWGLTQVEGDGDIAFLAAEGSPESYVIRLRADTDKRLDLISFGAANTADVDTLAEQLGTAGTTLISEPGTVVTPGGGYGFRFFDIDGRTVEVSADVEVREHRKIEEGEDIPVKLSHVVLNSPTPERTVAWYDEHLKFSLSDTLTSPHMGEVMWFLRTSPQHHSVAIARGPHVALHHASFEMRGIDEYMRGTGRLMRAGVQKIWGPGRHMAGNNTFTYFLDPHGNTVEYTTEMALLEEDVWHPHLYDFSDPKVSDQWGTAEPMGEFIAKASFNDPDKGLFTAPPGLMRFATYTLDGAQQCGVVAGEAVGRDVVHALAVADLATLIDGGLPAALLLGAEALATSRPVALSAVTLEAPLRPRTLRDFVAFEEHVAGVRRAVEGTAGVPDAWFEAPAFYFSNPASVCGTGCPVPLPGGSEALDFELEVAAVVGASGRDLDPATAAETLFGYTILNDWSARDLQGREMQVGLGPAKGKDFASTLGPWVVTADELACHLDDEGFLQLWCTAEVNGSVVGSDVLSNMSWTFGSLLAYASRDATLSPGDVLGSGTVGHGGCLAELWGWAGERRPPPLREGDVVTLRVQGIGAVSNTVVAGRVPAALPPPRRRDPAAARAAHQAG